MNRLKELERSESGTPLPTLRNKDIFKELVKDYIPGNFDQMPKLLKDDYVEFMSALMFDPRQQNVFSTTPDGATKAQKRGVYYDELDKKYLEEKKLLNPTR